MMRAARFYAAGDIRVEQVEQPFPSDEKVLVKVEWCGICGSDLNEYLKGPLAIPNSATGPHPLTGSELPVILGHEFSGRVLHAPANSHLVPGQAVVADPRLSCSHCRACEESVSNCCKTFGFLGLSGGGGGLSELVSVDPEKLHALPDDTDLAAAALIEPLAVAWHAVSRSKTGSFEGVPILVAGGGPIGVATAFVLRAWGSDITIVSEPALGRRKFLEDSGFDCIDPLHSDVGSRIKELTKHDGVDIVFDCAGSQASLNTGSDSLRFHGLYINLAVPKAPLMIPMHAFMAKELTYKSFLAYDGDDFRAAVDAFSHGRFKGVEKMITLKIALEDIVASGFQVLVDKPETHLKVLVTPERK